MRFESTIKSGAVAAALAATLLAAGLAGLAAPAFAGHLQEETPGAYKPRLVMPLMNPERGKKLFVNKGCVACHAINGVGGHDAPAMDAHTMEGLMSPFDFAAKMWNHATGMIAAQEGALGEQINFTGDELADIIAFVHDDEAQHDFSEADLSKAAREMMDHGHEGAAAPEAHAKELGHDHEEAPAAKPENKGTGGHEHAPGTPPHKD